MVQRTWLPNVALLLILLFVMVTPAYAGGIHVLQETIRISGSPDRKFQPNEPISVNFRIDEYHFGSDEFEASLEYLIFALVQKADSKQRATNEWQFFHMLLVDRRVKNSTPRKPGPLLVHLEFPAPQSLGRYKLLYHRIPMFTRTLYKADDQLGVLAASPGGKTRGFSESGFGKLVDFEVSLTSRPDKRLKLYLKLNGKTPTFEEAKGGRLDRPLEFSWFVKGSTLPADKISYSYNLWPENDGWTAWTTDTAVRYHFLQKGHHTFAVKARYQDGDRVIESPDARYDFTLEDHLVVKPSKEVLYKGSTTKQITVGGEDISPTIEFDSVYAKSKALIVGVWQFDDKKFPSFPEDKIRKDIITIEDALQANGFEVTTLFKQRLSRDEIATALAELVSGVSDNDRLFIYFSTHGFSDPKMPSDGYIATSDCEMDKPSVRCFRLGDIEQQARRALAAKARQVLIAVDSCFSGLGVITKSAQPPNLAKLGAAQGLFMMTAGMADQLAEIDPSLKMSTFTHYLSKGLKARQVCTTRME